MSRKIAGAIKWKGSKAREILLHDIEHDILPFERPAIEAWNAVYSYLIEFDEVPYQQFKKQVEAHREQVLKRKEKAADDEVRLRNYRTTNPSPIPFHDTEASRLLRLDVEDEVGHEPEMRTEEFRLRRPEYKEMEPRTFGGRLRQERRYRKFCNHLENKRAADPYANPDAEPSLEDVRSPIDDDDDNDGNFLNSNDDTLLPDGLTSLTVAQLKDQLRCRGLRLTGNKQVLIDRLAKSMADYKVNQAPSKRRRTQS